MTIDISICVPVYNWDISQLISSLSVEIDLLLEQKINCEVIVLDDCSEEYFSEKNKSVLELYNSVYYYSNEFNLGRSRSRNKIVSMANSDYVLLLDCDVVPDSDSFIRKYYDLTRNGNFKGVACGGVSYKKIEVTPISDCWFYYQQGKKISTKNAIDRNIAPWKWLFTANIFLNKIILEKIPFCEDFKGYGYEDIEWGIRLDEEAALVHIDNTVTHLGVLDKKSYLEKINKSFENLQLLLKKHPEKTRDLRVYKLSKFFKFFPVKILNEIYLVLEKYYLKYNFPYMIQNVIFQLMKCIGFSIKNKG